jgi:hypothetical protein
MLLLLVLAVMRAPAEAQQAPAGALAASVRAQIAALHSEKTSRTETQRKIDSNLLYGLRITSGLGGLPSSLQVDLPMTADGRVLLDVRADVSAALLSELRALGAGIVESHAGYRHVAVRAPLAMVELIAAIPEVAFVTPELGWLTSTGAASVRMVRVGEQRHDLDAAASGAAGASRVRDRLSAALRHFRGGQNGFLANAGPVTSQGDATHRASEARAAFGVDGTGVKIGVLSDGVNSLAASQAAGELGAVTVLAGQAGSGDEGTAMLEIVHDLAPGAQLYFATAVPAGGSIAGFAQNIRALRTAGCDIIVDDVGYFVESPFQDGQSGSSQFNSGVVAQAVKDVAASGALYFSAAANSGRADAATSGTWEGDFADGGPAPTPRRRERGKVILRTGGPPPPFSTILARGYISFPMGILMTP